jgi:hypothetical protein
LILNKKIMVQRKVQSACKLYFLQAKVGFYS